MNDTNDVLRWTNAGNTIGATHLLVMCDEFDFTYYPKYVMPTDNLNDKIKEFCTEMQVVKEVVVLK